MRGLVCGATFAVETFKVMIGEPYTRDHGVVGSGSTCSAMIKIAVDGVEEITAAEGCGPVNALDLALRKALMRFYPILERVRLSDYKVRVSGSDSATASVVKVFIESTDGTVFGGQSACRPTSLTPAGRLCWMQWSFIY